jgi:hypothetical protein
MWRAIERTWLWWIQSDEVKKEEAYVLSQTERL